jgi:hypothetical protein
MTACTPFPALASLSACGRSTIKMIGGVIGGACCACTAGDKAAESKSAAMPARIACRVFI